jgi:glucose/arabinose dehydrogenase
VLVAEDFDHPVLLTSPRLDTRRLFVLEQVGAIQIIEDGARVAEPFLDIRARVRQDIEGDDRGMLGLAFHPDYEDNGRFYVSYGDLFGMQRIAELTVTADPNVADPDSEIVVLDLPAADSHNGGMLQFGPDRMLYASTGDGLPQCTPAADVQDPAVLQGKILRLDASVAGEVSIPADNPFGTEAYAVGLRNPWRFGIDFTTGDIWIGDVGFKTYEEIDRLPGGSGGGENFGWPTMEGPDCNPCHGEECDIPEGYVAPVQWYDHGDGLSVVAGRVYRGRALPDIEGLFFYADFYTGTIWSIDPADPQGSHTTWPMTVSALSAFGEDACREIYVVSLDGDVFRVAPE